VRSEGLGILEERRDYCSGQERGAWLRSRMVMAIP
jgi:hypothetical protein